jgi:hypothetical protein
MPHLFRVDCACRPRRACCSVLQCVAGVQPARGVAASALLRVRGNNTCLLRSPGPTVTGTTPSRYRNQSTLPSTILSQSTTSAETAVPRSHLLSFPARGSPQPGRAESLGRTIVHAADPFGNSLCCVSRESVFTGPTDDESGEQRSGRRTTPWMSIW